MGAMQQGNASIETVPSGGRSPAEALPRVEGRFAEVALASSGPTTFTYEAAEGITPGCLVLAPLGSRRVAGIVMRVCHEPPAFPTRPLLDLLFPGPLVEACDTEVALWMARTYHASVWECVSLFLPPGLTTRLSQSLTGLERWLSRRLGEPLDGPSPAAALAPPVALTPAQEQALAPLEHALAAGQHRVFLLYGVTGSGKTHVYLSAARQVIAAGGQVIVLVSEIALTPEAEVRFSALFPGRVQVLHSELSPAQRDRAWVRIARGEAALVVGSRSAVFAPARRLRLLVVDEEHEWTYKQESAPRYHARSVAMARAHAWSAGLVLSSATPEVSTYYHARSGRFRLLHLPERYGGEPTGEARGAAGHLRPAFAAPARLPAVEVVDLRRELREGNRSIFSRSLAAALAETLRRGEQAILFLNRRGAATCVTCRDCGHTLQCRRCETPLAYHVGGLTAGGGASAGASLLCHRCNRRRALTGRCPRCGSSRIRFLGTGTQRVEQEVRARWPEARVQRWDRDAVSARGAHQRLWQAFAAGEVDILVGTQMVAKALDVPTVTLVGAVLADSGLYLPDFRAAERTFQLLTQVAGRAGRGSRPGRAIIQTYAPEHYAIVAAARHDYEAFYEREIAFRRRFGYPPFRRLCRLVVSHADEARCWREAARVRRLLAERNRRLDLVDLEVLGPAPCFQRRVRGRYRWQVLLCGEGFERVLDDLPLGHGWAVDVDPVSVL